MHCYGFIHTDLTSKIDENPHQRAVPVECFEASREFSFSSLAKFKLKAENRQTDRGNMPKISRLTPFRRVLSRRDCPSEP